MNKLFLTLLTISFCIFSQNINLERSSEEFVKLENEVKVMPDEGFYQNIHATVNKKGDLFVLDVGNSQLQHYDKSGKLVTSFGKEGNGPGEFPSFLFDVTVNAKYLYIKAFNKIMIFDYKGKLIKEIPGFSFLFSQITFIDNQVHFVNPKTEFSKTIKSIYSQEGELISEVKNDKYDPMAMQKMQTQFDDAALKKGLKRPISFYPFKGKYAEAYQGDYNFKLVDDNLKVHGHYKAEYDRIKVKSFVELLPRTQQNIYEKSNDQVKAIFEQIGQKLMALTGAYKRDIVTVSGADDKYIYIQTSTDKDMNLKLDVVDVAKKKISTIQLKSDLVLSSKVRHGYLLLCLYNDDDGPYLKAWKLKHI